MHLTQREFFDLKIGSTPKASHTKNDTLLPHIEVADAVLKCTNCLNRIHNHGAAKIVGKNHCKRYKLRKD